MGAEPGVLKAAILYDFNNTPGASFLFFLTIGQTDYLLLGRDATRDALRRGGGGHKTVTKKREESEPRKDPGQAWSEDIKDIKV